MRWQYDQHLVEGAVFQELRRLEDRGQPEAMRRFHRMTDGCYDLPEGESREQAFFAACWQIFRECGFEQVVPEALTRYPRVSAQVPEGVVAPARSEREEKAELFSRDETPSTVELRVRATQFQDRHSLSVWCRHELCHIDDMLDPAFAYAREGLTARADTLGVHLTRERYRLLWAISVDGRMAQTGSAPLRSREERFTDLTQAFPGVQEQEADILFDRLWQGQRPSHTELLEMAQQFSPLAGIQAAGLPCPLCAFPTHVWGEVTTLPEAAQAKIQAEFPSWVPSDGLCERCAEVYTVDNKRRG